MKKKPKTFREMYGELLERPVDSLPAADIQELLINLPGGTRNFEAIARAQIFKALKGDTTAAKYISSLMGEETAAPPDVNITVKVEDNEA